MHLAFHRLPIARHGIPHFICRALLGAAFACAWGFAAAHAPSVTECTEGSDFIRDAALARDNGMNETGFMERLQQDIRLIQAFPPALRWFVQDDDDVAFLVSAAGEVFRQPKTPAMHQEKFFKACLGKTSGMKTIGL